MESDVRRWVFEKNYTVCSTAIINDFGGGQGTSTYPYLICNMQQWNYFTQTTSSWNKNIKLKADLDFTGVAFADFKTANWTGLMGGLVGGVSSGTTNLIRTYFVGTQTQGIIGPAKKGCLVANNSATLNIVDSSYDLTICLSNSVDSGAYAGANGLTTGDLQVATPFLNWLPSVWTFTAAQNPKLAFEP